jgi:hypothetical protein
MSDLSKILHDFGIEYVNRFKDKIPRNHIKAIYEIANCRTPVMGGQVYYCQKCHKKHYRFKSCGNRACNRCQNDQSEKWLAKWLKLLLPTHHFLATFTLPEKLRKFARSNQRLFYDLMFRASSEALKVFAKDPKYLGGMTGSIGVLHTWARDLTYHPHIHYIIAGGCYIEEKGFWISANGKFLVPVKALSKIFRAKFRDLLEIEAPDIFKAIGPKIWKQSWVVHCQHAANGHNALRYLARYVFKVALANSRIIKVDDKTVTFKYKKSKTQEWKTISLDIFEFIRRFLQHVLPKNFIKVRAYGFYANHNRHILKEIKTAFSFQGISMTDAEKSFKQGNDSLSYEEADDFEFQEDDEQLKTKAKQIICPHCGKIMIKLKDLEKLSFPNKAPPGIKYKEFIQTFFSHYKIQEAKVYLSLMPVH